MAAKDEAMEGERERENGREIMRLKLAEKVWTTYHKACMSKSPVVIQIQGLLNAMQIPCKGLELRVLSIFF